MLKSRWLIFCATIRSKTQTAPTFARLYASLTQPTDVIIVDGTKRKSVEENRIIQRLAADYTMFASIDDDLLVPGPGWQKDIAGAFQDVPKLGAAAIEYADTPELNAYIVEKEMQYTFNKTIIRINRTVNLPGACIVMPTNIVQQIGEVPHVEGVTFEVWEDGYKCKRLHEMGYRWGYVRCHSGYADIQKYEDDPAYLKFKTADIEYFHKHGTPWK